VRSTLTAEVDRDELQFTLIEKITEHPRNASDQITKLPNDVHNIYIGGIMQEEKLDYYDLKCCFLKIYISPMTTWIC
jgi:hypothetical protein